MPALFVSITISSHLKEEFVELINDELMPYIPKIGLLSGGATVIEKIIKKRMGMKEPPDVDLDS